jgi:excisionase family DNA binding protein
MDVDGATEDISPTAAPITLAPIPRMLLKPREAAAALGISPRLLWSKTKLGEIPCIRLGKAVRYSPAALQEWIHRAGSDA